MDGNPICHLSSSTMPLLIVCIAGVGEAKPYVVSPFRWSDLTACYKNLM